MLKNLSRILKFINVFFVILSINISAYAASSKAYTAADLEKISIIIAIVILIFSPKKFRIVAIGTILGITLAYLTYKYVLPMFIGSLNYSNS